MNSVKSPLQELIERVVVEKADLSKAETVFAFDSIFHGNESDITIGSFLTALAMKGESEDEILGAYEAVREKDTRLDLPSDHPLISAVLEEKR